MAIHPALSGGPLVQARNFSVMTGVNAGISCVMKRLRWKEDVQFRIFLLVIIRVQHTNIHTRSVFYPISVLETWPAEMQFPQPPVEDVNYSRTKSMLNSLGLQNYEKNFKKGLSRHTTLPLLIDSALRDVKIPPGPRLLILDHIQRDPTLREKQGCRG
ncbi:chloroplastic import inner membrane translocase subunit HP30-2-like [Hibiscus syriacus]|uniref:chloroplastic import inner membrane translocase subunit HP30-2-like n=1 Tax=Hibiscus syriacus TaxID=106335 RepID=UPI001920BB35|nr:chloroplastic import inner membrane translocase subunit HP30-2-like [Hibiscus syriacus]